MSQPTTKEDLLISASVILTILIIIRTRLVQRIARGLTDVPVVSNIIDRILQYLTSGVDLDAGLDTQQQQQHSTTDQESIEKSGEDSDVGETSNQFNTQHVEFHTNTVDILYDNALPTTPIPSPVSREKKKV